MSNCLHSRSSKTGKRNRTGRVRVRDVRESLAFLLVHTSWQANNYQIKERKKDLSGHCCLPCRWSRVVIATHVDRFRLIRANHLKPFHREALTVRGEALPGWFARICSGGDLFLTGQKTWETATFPKGKFSCPTGKLAL